MGSIPSNYSDSKTPYFVLRKFYLSFLCYAIFLYVFMGIAKFSEIGSNFVIYFANFFTVFSYFVLLHLFADLTKKIEMRQFLFVIFVYSTIVWAINLYLYSRYTGMLFEFTGSDSFAYHSFAQDTLIYHIFEGIQNFIKFTKYNFDDAGFVFYVSLLYRLSDSIIVVRIFNLFLNLISLYLLYNIASRFLHRKLATICVLSFGLASYTIYYQSSGLKETLMAAILISSFYFFYKFFEDRRNISLFLFLITTSLLMFFRIPLVPFVLISIAGSLYLSRKWNLNRVTIMAMFFCFSVGIGVAYDHVLERYTRSVNTTLRTSQGIEKPDIIMRSTAILSGFYGPLPSVVPVDTNRDTVMYGPGLLLKVFMSTSFLFGTYFVFKRRFFLLMPFVFFCIFHIATLILLTQTFKLRNHFPYFPFFFIVSYYGFQIIMTEKGHALKKQVLYITNIGMMMIVFLWNYLRM